MKPDLPRPTDGLTFEVLERFAETIAAPFRRAFGCGRVDLLPPPPDGGLPFGDGAQLLIPLAVDGNLLALVAPAGVRPDAVDHTHKPLVRALAEAALELARLRLAAEIDPVTGLANENALDDVLTGALARLSAAPSGARSMDGVDEQAGLALLVIEPQSMSALLDRHGRRMADRLLLELSRAVREVAAEAICLARVGERFLVLIKGGAGQANQLARRLRPELEGLKIETPGGGPWPVRVVMGAATADAMARAGRLAAEAAALFKARALRAAARAAADGGEGLLFFGEIVESRGRIKEIMPLDKVLIDLGRAHGLSEGERFGVIGRGGEEAKAQVVVVELGEEASVAELVSLDDPTRPPRPGDRLQRVGVETPLAVEAEQEQMVEVAGRLMPVVLDEVTGLICHRSFTNLFAALAGSGEPFAAALVRADGLEGMREALGRMAVESFMRGLSEAARQVLPPEVLLGRHSSDTLAFIAPGLDTAGAEELCRSLAQQVGRDTERTVSAGVAGHPLHGFEAAEVLDNAAKALVHAGFFGPDSMVAFDAVSLNISGDALFNRGRIGEALAEYERALLIDPTETNVLNSLGVCHGHLGQMEKAAEYFQRAQETAPQDFMAYYNLGYALLARGDAGQARRQLEKALELNPEHTDTLFQLGRLSQSEGHTAQAVEFFQAAEKLPDCRPAVHRHLGEALAAVGRAAEAEDAYKRAVKVGPSDAAALAGLAGLYLSREANLDIALSMAGRAMKLEPGAARHWRTAASVLVKLGRLTDAAELLADAAELHRSDPFVLVHWGRVERMRGDNAAARDLMLKALALSPNLDEARQALADLDQ